MIKSIINNPSFLYIISRYITYCIQFLNSILIAVSLGPLYLGVWGFLSLVIQYLSQINFGIAHSVNTIASIHKNKELYLSKIIGNAVVLTSLLCLFLGIIFLINIIFGLNFGDKFNFSAYIIPIFLIIVLTYFNSLLSNMLRIYNKITELAIGQSVLPFITLVTFFVFEKENLLNALVWSNLLATFISFSIYLIRFPINIKINLNIKLWKKIQKIGWHLFIYNTSFYLIVISTRWFVSYYYDIIEFGYFTFSFSLSAVLSLLLDSFTFLVWPKMLNRLAKLNVYESNKLILEVGKLYTTATHCILHFGICIFPYFLLLFPKYSQIGTSFSLISLTVVLFTNSFGYQGLLIARGKEKNIGRASFFILILNMILCYTLINFVHISYDYVILATFICYIVYNIYFTSLGRKALGKSLNFTEIFNDFFPYAIFIPFIISFFLIIFKADYYYLVLPVITFIIFNFKNLIEIIRKLKNVMVNQDFFKI